MIIKPHFPFMDGHAFVCLSPAVGDQLNEAVGYRERDVHLTTEVANCHSVPVFKGNWAHLQSGATDGQPGGAVFEPQWNLQYGQSAAQQAHQS